MKNNKKVLKDVTSVLEISGEHIQDFAKAAPREDYIWITKGLLKCTKQSDPQKAFAKFRRQFAEKYLPELIKKKKPSKKPTILDTLMEGLSPEERDEIQQEVQEELDAERENEG